MIFTETTVRKTWSALPVKQYPSIAWCSNTCLYRSQPLSSLATVREICWRSLRILGMISLCPPLDSPPHVQDLLNDEPVQRCKTWTYQANTVTVLTHFPVHIPPHMVWVCKHLHHFHSSNSLIEIIQGSCVFKSYIAMFKKQLEKRYPVSFKSW